MSNQPRGPARRRRRSLFVVLVATAAAVGAMAGATPAGAAEQQDVVVRQEAGMTVSIPNPKLKTKPNTAPDGGHVQPLQACGTQCYLFPSDSKTITPPGGTAGTIRSQGQTNYIEYVVPFVGNRTKVDFYNTSSSSAWSGLTPFNCTSVTHQDVWDIDYIAVSWSYSGAPSGTTSFGSGRIGIAHTVADTWRITHSVSHLILSVNPSGTIYWAGYEVHGSYQFGSAFYTTDGYSATWFR